MYIKTNKFIILGIVFQLWMRWSLAGSEIELIISPVGVIKEDGKIENDKIHESYENEVVNTYTIYRWSRKDKQFIILNMVLIDHHTPIKVTILVSNIRDRTNLEAKRQNLISSETSISVVTGSPQDSYLNLTFENDEFVNKQQGHGLTLSFSEFFNNEKHKNDTYDSLFKEIEKFTKHEITELYKNYQVYTGSFLMPDVAKNSIPITIRSTSKNKYSAERLIFYTKGYRIEDLKTEGRLKQDPLVSLRKTQSPNRLLSKQYSSFSELNEQSDMIMNKIESKIYEAYETNSQPKIPLVKFSLLNKKRYENKLKKNSDTHSNNRNKFKKKIENKKLSFHSYRYPNKYMNPYISDSGDCIYEGKTLNHKECILLYHSHYNKLFENNEANVNKRINFDLINKDDAYERDHYVKIKTILLSEGNVTDLDGRNINKDHYDQYNWSNKDKEQPGSETQRKVKRNSRTRFKRKKSSTSLEVNEPRHTPSGITDYRYKHYINSNTGPELAIIENPFSDTSNLDISSTTVDYSNIRLEQKKTKTENNYETNNGKKNEFVKDGGSKIVKIVVGIVVVLSFMGIIFILVKIYRLYSK